MSLDLLLIDTQFDPRIVDNFKKEQVYRKLTSGHTSCGDKTQNKITNYKFNK